MKNLRGTIAFALVLGTFPCFGAYDAFLKIDGIKGEATDAAHNGWIEVASFSWGMTSPTTSVAIQTKSNPQGCATNELHFAVRGAAIVPLQKLVIQGAHLQSVALDVNGQRHVLDGATLSSCQTLNIDQQHSANCVMKFLRCATHAPAAVNASMLNRNAIQTQPNASFSLGDDPAQEVSIIAVHPGGSNDVLITERGASPAFFRNCVAGAHYKKVTLNMRKAGGTFTLRDALVTRVTLNGDGSVSLGLKYGMADGSVRAYQDLH